MTSARAREWCAKFARALSSEFFALVFGGRGGSAAQQRTEKQSNDTGTFCASFGRVRTRLSELRRRGWALPPPRRATARSCLQYYTASLELKLQSQCNFATVEYETWKVLSPILLLFLVNKKAPVGNVVTSAAPSSGGLSTPKI